MFSWSEHVSRHKTSLLRAHRNNTITFDSKIVTDGSTPASTTYRLLPYSLQLPTPNNYTQQYRTYNFLIGCLI